MGHPRREGFQVTSRVDDARRVFFEAIGDPPIKLETIPIDRAWQRVLGEDTVADVFVPSEDRSVMDGYAVRSEDVRDASDENPMLLYVVGESRLGKIPRLSIKAGQAVAVATGSIIPKGADAVVMVEDTKILDKDMVAVHAPVPPGQNISKKGEDIRPGTLVLRKGVRLRPQDMTVLKAVGRGTARVVRCPRIGIISTGNELVDSPKKRETGKVVDVNRPSLCAMVREQGAVPVDLGIAKDSEVEITRVLKKGLRSCDAILVTAGSSVGERDLVPKCINALGKPGMLVHGVAMRPSLPTGLGLVNGKPILSLPGFPVSAMIAFRVFGRPLIAKLMGTTELAESTVKAILTERIGGPVGFRTFVRVMLRRTENGFVAEPLKLQRSSALMSMVSANGIVTIPEDVGELEAGQVVDVLVIGPVA